MAKESVGHPKVECSPHNSFLGQNIDQQHVLINTCVGIHRNVQKSQLVMKSLIIITFLKGTC